jgi:hypothetical protein
MNIMHTTLPPVAFGSMTLTEMRRYFEPTAFDDTDWHPIRDALRFSHAVQFRAFRAPLVAALHLTDDTILKRIVGAALDYHSTPQGAFEEEGGADAMRGIADTLRNAADAMDTIADRMEEQE